MGKSFLSKQIQFCSSSGNWVSKSLVSLSFMDIHNTQSNKQTCRDPSVVRVNDLLTALNYFPDQFCLCLSPSSHATSFFPNAKLLGCFSTWSHQRPRLIASQLLNYNNFNYVTTFSQIIDDLFRKGFIRTSFKSRIVLTIRAFAELGVNTRCRISICLILILWSTWHSYFKSPIHFIVVISAWGIEYVG